MAGPGSNADKEITKYGSTYFSTDNYTSIIGMDMVPSIIGIWGAMIGSFVHLLLL